MKQKPAKRIIYGFVVIVTVYILQQMFFKTPSFDKIMMDIVSEMNENYPIMVDRDTRLDSVSFITIPDNVLQFNYTLINWVKDSFFNPMNVEDLRNYTELNILKNVKQIIRTDPVYSKIFSKNKGIMAFHYRDKNGEFVLKIMITPEQYNQ